MKIVTIVIDFDVLFDFCWVTVVRLFRISQYLKILFVNFLFQRRLLAWKEGKR